MILRNHAIRKLTAIVGPERVLTDPEDLYVYSFERLYEEPRYPHFDAVGKAGSEGEIAQETHVYHSYANSSDFLNQRPEKTTIPLSIIAHEIPNKPK